MAVTPVIVYATDLNGNVQSGAKLYPYAAGTTTPQATYTDSGLGTPAAHPVVCDSSGRAVVWMDSSLGDYKLILTNSAGSATYFSQDNIDASAITPMLLIYPALLGDQTLNTTDSPTFASVTLGVVPFSGVVTDPGADRLMFWDDSDTQVEWLDLGTGLSITANTLSLDADLVAISGLTPDDGAFIVGDGSEFVAESGATARASLGLTIGTNVLAYDANLQAFATAFTAPTADGAAGQYLKTDGAGVLTFATAAGAGDVLAAANETISGGWAFTGSPDFSGVPNAGKRGIVSDLGILTIFASAYGVTATVASDQSAGIQAAIDAAEALNGGEIILPRGTIRIDTGLVIDGSRVHLNGIGADDYHNVSGSTAGTIIAAYGTDIDMLTIASATSATGPKSHGSSFKGIQFDGRGEAANGVVIRSHDDGRAGHFSIINCKLGQLVFDTMAAGDLGEGTDNQDWQFLNYKIDTGNDYAATAAAKGVILDNAGDGGGNTSYNIFRQGVIRHKNGLGMHLKAADNNLFIQTRIRQVYSGTGDALTIDGQTTGGKVNETNFFQHFWSNGDVNVLSAADTNPDTAAAFDAGSDSSRFLLDESNSPPAFNISTGSRAIRERFDGFKTGDVMLPLALGQNVTNAQAAIDNIGSASLVIANGSDGHLKLVSGDGTSQAWNVNVEASSGNLRLTRTAGSGSVTTGQAVTATGRITSSTGFTMDAVLPTFIINISGTENGRIYPGGSAGDDLIFEGKRLCRYVADSANLKAVTRHQWELDGTSKMQLDAPGDALFPTTDADLDLGKTALRWNTAYVGAYEATTSYSVAGNQVVGARQAAIADTSAPTAYTAHASGAVAVTSNAATDLDITAAAVATLRSEVATLTTDLNAVKAMLRTHGLIAT
jgi:hypothetical protein